VTDHPQLQELAGYDLGTHVVEYDDTTVILYALAVGAPANQLELVFERDLRAIPTLACALGLWAVEGAGALGAYDPRRSLHARQLLTMHGTLPTSGPLEMQGRVTNVFDKGKAALIEVEASAECFTATYGIFLPGMGGWGGDRGPSAGSTDGIAFTQTDEAGTSPALAALYRLTGDRHPLHIDPDVATANGFDRPILHGLCTVGIAARISAQAAGCSPADLLSLDVRLSSPVFPGDTIAVDTLVDAENVDFQARVGDVVVLAGGRAAFGGPMRS
jgi:hypothetical protein